MPMTAFPRRFLMMLTVMGLLSLAPAWAQSQTADKDKDEADAKEEKKTDEKVVVPVFSLRATITEKPIAEDLPFAMGSTPESFLDFTKRLRKAVDDKEVKGIVFLDGEASFSIAQIEELHQILNDFKKAGKKIYAHADWLDTRK